VSILSEIARIDPARIRGKPKAQMHVNEYRGEMCHRRVAVELGAAR
jgi:hypothetical protein